jgi:hypothetical protein
LSILSNKKKFDRKFLGSKLFDLAISYIALKNGFLSGFPQTANPIMQPS